MAYVTSEISKLQPVHLRALLTYFFFGRKGNSRSESGLGPADAGWASMRDRRDQEVASLLNMSEGATLQVLATLRRDGYLDRDPLTQGGDAVSRASEWTRRVLATLFPEIEIHAREVTEESRDDGDASATKVPAIAETKAADRESDPYMREHRAIAALEEEIKKVERERLGPLAIRGLTNDSEWLATLKRRLRRVDPDNPWAYDDF